MSKNLYILLGLIFLIPVIVTPAGLANPFWLPKFITLFIGVALLLLLSVHKMNTVPKMVILLSALSVFSLFYTKNLYYTRIAVVLNISCLLIYWFVSQEAKKHGVLILKVIMASGVFVSFVTYLQYLGHPIFFNWLAAGSTIGTIGNSNYLAAYLLFPLYAAGGLIFATKNKLYLIPALFIFGAFFLSRGRAAWLALGLSAPVFLFLLGFDKRWIYGFIIGLCICIAVGWIFIPHGLKNWTETGSLRHRMKHWEASVYLFLSSPIFGTGLWSFRNMVYESQAQIAKADENYFHDYVEPKPRRVHNDYLEILNDGGILGFSVLALFLFRILWKGYQAILRSDWSDKAILATSISSIVAIMISAIFFFPVRVISTLFMISVSLGLIQAMACDS